MAEAVLSALIEIIFEKMSSQILEYRMLGGTEKEMSQLRSILLTIQDVLEEAEDQQLRNKTVKNWLMKLKDAAYDADDLLDEYMMEALEYEVGADDNMKFKDCMINMVCNFFSRSNPFIFHYKMKCRLKQIGERLNSIANERSKFHLKNSNVNQTYQSSGRLQSDSFLLESDVCGRDRDREEIIKLLTDNSHGDVSVIPIVGIGGLGKTTLAKLAYNDKRADKHFQQRIWVCVSEDFDVKRIMRAILESATGNTCHLQEMEVIQQRIRELVMGKRFLLVLDDVWSDDHDKWERLKNSVRHGSEGSKILVTTRSEKVALIMGTIAPYYLKGLPEDDCWSLFEQRAFKLGVPKEASIVAIGNDIVKKCRGVPLAAKTLGSLMCFKREKSEWVDVKDSEIWNLLGGENGILQVLRLSYDDLPSHLKQCFAYCSIFPKDYCIEKENLVQLWMAEGFLPSSGRKAPEEVGNEYFNELLWRSVSGSDCSAVEVGRQVSIPAATRHISMVCKEREFVIPKSLLNAGKVRSFLLLVGWQKIPKVSHNFISSFKSLRALDISSTRAKKLSKSIGALKHLRSLVKLPNGIGKLSSLQTLPIFIVGRGTASSIAELQGLDLHGELMIKNLENVMNKRCARAANLKEKRNLRSLKLLWEHVDEANVREHVELVIEGLQPSSDLKKLHVENYMGANFPCWLMNSSLSNLTELSLIRCQRCVQLPPLEKLSVLEVLSIDGMDATRYISDDSRTNDGVVDYASLKHLTLKNMPSLLGWSEMEERYLFSNLKKLTIVDCPNMTDFPNLPSVESLELTDCNIQLLRMAMVSTSLSNLIISGFLELVALPVGLLRNKMHLLSLEIKDCPKLRSLSGELQGLCSLQKLTISNCDKLESFLESGSLKSLISLSIHGCHSLESLPEAGIGDLKSLQNLSLSNCENLMGLPETMQLLTGLQILSISSCSKLDTLPEWLGTLFHSKSWSFGIVKTYYICQIQ
ncbi:putative disease resistance protein RGA4 [Vitis vinifera]|uniref:Putative disease resistance protein RGA4 n=1 Tax=Vitis vinifera TaxID=29760 RepID=A0A438C917_VITVI|nr:putative disease resistance protein RGA4 [Vitis vinifera]